MSKFDDIFEAAGKAPAEKRAARKRVAKKSAVGGHASAAKGKRPGRPAGPSGGKRSREDYRQGSVYLPLTVFDDVRDKLSKENRGKRQKGANHARE